jgi:hypothetical protein
MLMCVMRIKPRKIFRAFSLSNLVIAIGSERDIAAFWTASGRIMQCSCNICIKESLLTRQMHRQNKSPREIRTAIIQGLWATVGASTQ